MGAHWPKNVLRVLSPLLRKLGDSHGHLIVAAQPARGVILLQGPGEKISLALPGLRQLVAEHFPDAEVPKELLTPCEQAAAAPEEEEAKSPASEPDVEMVKAERAAADTPQELAAKALRRAYATRSASAMRIALGAACAARVAPAHLEEGERWLRELQAGAALGDALASGEVAELQRALNAAREAQVPEERLDEAELQLGRLQAEQNLQEALAGSEAELREALAQARALGAEALEAAEAALCTKAAEAELLAAMELVGGLQAADEETELVFGSAVREAHSAGVVGPTLAQAEAKLQALRDARQAAAAQSERPADENAAENVAGEPPAKRQRSETEGEEAVEGVEAWARCLLEAAVLRCCKRRAIEAEETWPVERFLLFVGGALGSQLRGRFFARVIFGG
ncbi:unnamed protein product [Effrenium voratum]|nr:unnamed protein product [Effrenium voratum]